MCYDSSMESATGNQPPAIIRATRDNLAALSFHPDRWSVPWGLSSFHPTRKAVPGPSGPAHNPAPWAACRGLPRASRFFDPIPPVRYYLEKKETRGEESP